MLKTLREKFDRFAADFYNYGAGWVNRLGNLLKLPQFFTLTERYLSTRPAVLGVEWFVALSLTMYFFFLVRPAGLPAPDGNTMRKLQLLVGISLSGGKRSSATQLEETHGGPDAVGLVAGRGIQREAGFDWSGISELVWVIPRSMAFSAVSVAYPVSP